MPNLVLPVLAYIAGPYRDPRGAGYIRRNIESARAIAERLWSAGIPTICPHLNTALMDGLAHDDVWLRGDLVILLRCDVLVLTPDWERSAGARHERDEARMAGMPVWQWADDAAGVIISEIREWARERASTPMTTPDGMTGALIRDALLAAANVPVNATDSAGSNVMVHRCGACAVMVGKDAPA